MQEIQDNNCVVILGETGSGKTTRTRFGLLATKYLTQDAEIPQFIFEAGLCQEPLMIAVTQPRKVAATSLAARVAAEQAKPLGSLVGYSVRFDEKSSVETRIKYMTDGMLGRELLADPQLSRYGVVIIDEAHERTLRTDLLLTALKSLLIQRNAKPVQESKNGLKDEHNRQKGLAPLRVIIMSATLDAQRFSQFFNK